LRTRTSFIQCKSISGHHLSGLSLTLPLLFLTICNVSPTRMKHTGSVICLPLTHTWYSACTAFGEAVVPTPGLEGGVGCNPRVTFDGKVRNLGLGVLKFGSSDGQDAQSRIVLPPETGDQPSSLSSGLSDAPRLNRRRPGYLYSIIEYE
jgi:hypothetical protein